MHLMSDFLIDLANRAKSAPDGERYAWDIISCLRSEDGGDDNFKRLTVERLRYVVMQEIDEGTEAWESSRAFGNQPTFLNHPLTLTDIKIRDDLLRHSSLHFQEHWYFAVAAVKALYHYDLDKEEAYEH